MHKGIMGFFRFVGSVALVFFLGACATGGSPHGGPSGTGVVMSIAESEVGSRTGSIVGAIGGAIVGSVVGGQIGSGFGRTVASTAGSIGASMIGSSMGSRMAADREWTITVRFSDGIDRDIRSKTPPEVRPGDKVSVDNGEIRRH